VRRPPVLASVIILAAIALLSAFAPLAPAAATATVDTGTPATATAPAATAQAQDVEAAGNWIDVPYVAQPKDGCGAAAISMVMQYWAGQRADPSAQASGSALPVPVTSVDPAAASDVRTIQSLLFVPKEKGIPATAMIAYFENSGFRAYAFRGDWSDLAHHIQQGRPLIVSLAASGPHGPLHYAVVAGIDAQRNYVFLNDPARGKLQRISRAAFQSEWNSAKNWTLLAVPAARG
jgi:predicted double-glycine peptidase